MNEFALGERPGINARASRTKSTKGTGLLRRPSTGYAHQSRGDRERTWRNVVSGGLLPRCADLFSVPSVDFVFLARALIPGRSPRAAPLIGGGSRRMEVRQRIPDYFFNVHNYSVNEVSLHRLKRRKPCHAERSRVSQWATQRFPARCFAPLNMTMKYKETSLTEYFSQLKTPAPHYLEGQ